MTTWFTSNAPSLSFPTACPAVTCPGHRTSEENMVAQVPMHQQTTGLVRRPSLMPRQILYSSVPPICGATGNKKKPVS